MRRLAFLLTALFGLTAALAQEPKVPDTPPPPELVGRWMEKTPQSKGDFTGYNIYCFSAQAEFLVLSRVWNKKTRRWAEATRLYPKPRPGLLGYFEATGPDSLRFQVVVYAMAVLPVEVQYRIESDTLTLSKDLFDPINEREVRCERVQLLPGETAEEAAGFAQRLEGGLNGPDFRRVFEFAARQMHDHPADTAMIFNFHEHRDEFETLRTMMTADAQLKRIAFTFTEPKDLAAAGVTAERVEVYRELCRRVGLENGLEAYADVARRIAFLASGRGLGGTRSEKNYVWLRDPPPEVVDDLEAHARRLAQERREYFAQHKRAKSGNVTAYRRLEEHWYLEYRFQD